MMSRIANAEHYVIKMIRTAVGAIVAGGAFAVQYYGHGEQATVITVVAIIGWTHILIEYNDRQGDPTDPAA